MFAFLVCCSAPLPVTHEHAPEPKPLEADRDGNGIPDRCDYCPGAPGRWTYDDDDLRGCPWACELAWSAYQTEIFFDGRPLPPLADLVLDLKKEWRHFFVVGTGPSEAIGLAHAQKIMETLISMGVSREKLEAHGRVGERSSVVFEPSHFNDREYRWNDARKEVERIPLSETSYYLPPCE